MSGWAISTDTGASESRGSVLGICNMRLVVRRVEILSIPATTNVLDRAQIFLNRITYVGYRMFERMPPGHGVVGKPSVSNLQPLVIAVLEPGAN